MQHVLCFLCGFAFMAGLGASISLALSLVATMVLLLIPVVLLVLVLGLPAWLEKRRVRRSWVPVYVPPEQRQSWW